METWIGAALDHLWRNAVAAVPLALLVAAACRWLPCKPTTRHALWVMLLAWLVLPPLLPGLQWQGDAAKPSVADETPAMPVAAIKAPAVPLTMATPPLPKTAPSPRAVLSPKAVLSPRTVSPTMTADIPVDSRRPSEVATTRPTADVPAMGKASQIGSQITRGPRDQDIDNENESVAVRSAKTAPVRSVPLARLAPRVDWTGPLPRPTRAMPRIAERHADGVFPRRERKNPRRDRKEAWALHATEDRSLTVASRSTTTPPSSKRYGGEPSESAGLPVATSVTLPTPVPVPISVPLPTSVAHPVSVIGDEAPTPAPQQELPLAARQALPPVTQQALSAWITALAKAREAFGLIPAMPMVVWLGGLLVVLATCAARTLAFRRYVGKATPAPESIRFAVRRTARRIGLPQAPRVLMVDGDVTPMVWCGRRPSLLLPRKLWSQLDRTGRDAIICHELAHLRRRDHWIRLGELVVAAVYWWHPLVWWIRRRLHEEAEVCCDAWVTWLMPRDRRAYAEALLQTKKYLSNQRDRMPAAGIGVTSGRAKRLARRITMVMTASARPGMSLPGVALVVSLAMAGWLVSPAQSCPLAKDDAKVKLAGDTARAHAKCEVKCGVDCPKAKCDKPCDKPCDNKKCVRCASGATSGTGQTSFERHVTQTAPPATTIVARGGGETTLQWQDGLTIAFAPTPASADTVVSAETLVTTAPSTSASGFFDAEAPSATVHAHGGHGQDGYVGSGHAHSSHGGRGHAHDTFVSADRDDDDGRSGRRIKKRKGRGGLEGLNDRVERLERRIDKLLDRMEQGEPAPKREPRWPRAMRSPRSPRPPAPPNLFPQSEPSPLGRVGTVAPLIVGVGVGTYTVSYELPEGKLEALAELMVRSDVPILVRPGDDSIAVTATAAQHGAFRAFVKMINDSGEQDEESYELPKGKLKALTALMGRSDVPVLISPGDDAINVQGNATQQAVFKAFVEMIHPGGERGADARQNLERLATTELQESNRTLELFGKELRKLKREGAAGLDQRDTQKRLLEAQMAEMRIQEKAQRKAMKEHRRAVREQEKAVRAQEKFMREQERAVRENEAAVREHERAKRQAERDAQRERENTKRESEKRNRLEKRKPKREQNRDERTDLKSDVKKHTST